MLFAVRVRPAHALSPLLDPYLRAETFSIDTS
jgi:hypothetical protein